MFQDNEVFLRFPKHFTPILRKKMIYARSHISILETKFQCWFLTSQNDILVDEWLKWPK